MLIEAVNSRLGLLISVATLIGMLFASIAWLDSRHVSAMDFQQMQGLMMQSEIARFEYQIEKAQRQIVRLKQIPEPERTREEVGELEDLQFEVEFLKRELDRLEDE